MRLTIVLCGIVALATLNGCYIFGGKNVSTGVNWEINIVYKNSKGENLLDPKTAGHYSIDSVKIRFLDNSGGSNMVVNTGSDGYYVTGIFYGPGDNKVEGVLQLNKKTYDTLTLLGDDELRRVLYNKKEIPLPANIATSANFFFTVVK
jgi:hypothetical protein